VSSAILLGLAMGLRHAVDPDHVAAVSTLAARERSALHAGFLGASWALGHGLMLAAIGASVLALRLSLPDALPRFADAGVGLLLVGLGIANFRMARANAPPAAARSLRGALARSAGIGLLHGLAGSGAVAVLAITAFPSPLAGGVYLGSFSLGLMAGMVVCSALLGAPFARLPRTAGLRRGLTAATGLVALALGVLLVWKALPADLFTS